MQSVLLKPIMFNWLRRKEEACRAGEIPQISAASNLDKLLQADLLILFKHSTSCPVSWAAHSEINRFRLKHPDVPVHIVHVIKERSTSMKIAELTGIRHESPQVIVVKNGAVLTAISHGSITEERLTSLAGEY
jgi:bacillithiol system protein YtxJ